MYLKSSFSLPNIPKCNVLDFLFPAGEPLSTDPIWLDSEDPSINLNKRQMVHRIKRLAVGLDKLGVKPGEVVMVFTPNHILVPIAYLGIAGSLRIFSGANPIYTADGETLGQEWILMY